MRKEAYGAVIIAFGVLTIVWGCGGAGWQIRGGEANFPLNCGPAALQGGVPDAVKGRQVGDIVPGRFIVVLRGEVNPLRVASDYQITPAFVYTAALKGFAANMSPSQVEALRKDPRVQSIEPDTIVGLIHPVRASRLYPRPPRQGETLPTGVNRIDAEQNPRVDVSLIGVAVIDTGIWKGHPDLNIAGGVNFVGDNPDPEAWNDENGHGTHVAGIIGALKDGQGIRGVAPGVRLFAVKVLSATGLGLTSWVIAGIDWVVAQKDALGIRIANMSLGAPDDDPNSYPSNPLEEAIQNAAQAGIIFTVAAGNDARDAKEFTPANSPDVICVSAIIDTDGKCGAEGPSSWAGGDDTFSPFSNFGEVVDLAAPGVDILSTDICAGYSVKSGTSMAAPHVAGAAAFYLATNPTATPSQVRSALVGQGVPQNDPCEAGSGHGGFTGDPDNFPEPLVYAKNL